MFSSGIESGGGKDGDVDGAESGSCILGLFSVAYVITVPPMIRVRDQTVMTGILRYNAIKWLKLMTHLDLHRNGSNFRANML